jgi:hypothetical protein
MTETLVLRDLLVPRGATANVFAIEGDHELFKPSRIVLPEATSKFFMVADIKVGMNSQLLSTSCFPASLFSELSHAESLDFDAVPRGRNFVLNVWNMDEAASWRSFGGVVLGEKVAGPDNRYKGEHAGRTVLGLGYTMVAPGATVLVRSMTQVVFKPDRVALPLSVLEDFEVLSLHVENYQGWKLWEISLPADRSVLDERRPGVLEPDGGTLQEAEGLVMRVRNKMSEDKPFFGSVLGAMSW